VPSSWQGGVGKAGKRGVMGPEGQEEKEGTRSKYGIERGRKREKG